MRLAVLAVALACLSPQAALAQDAAAGEAAFKKCMACHAVGENARNRVGPVLNGVFGRQAGTLADYKYSKAMVDAGAAGLVWTEETMAAFLTNPRAYVKGTKMAFGGLKNETETADIIAYLLTLSADYNPEKG